MKSVPKCKSSENTASYLSSIIIFSCILSLKIGAPPAPSFLPLNEEDFVVVEGSVNVTVRWSELQGY